MENYEETYRRFKWEIPGEFNFGFDIIDKWARENDKTALVTVDESLSHARTHSFSDLSRLSNQFANILRARGISRGDRVLIMLPQIPEWYIAVLGAIKLGAVFVPTPTLASSRDIEYRLKQCEASAVVTGSEFLGRFSGMNRRCPPLKAQVLIDGEPDGWISLERELSRVSAKFEPHPTRSTEPMLIYFTSGTTGYPKMVLHSHAYALAHIVTAKFVHDLSAADLHWTIADTGWAKTAWGKLFGQWVLGAALLQYDSRGKFDPANALKLLEKYEVTTFCAPPTAYRMLIQEDLKAHNLGRLRHCVSAGEPLNAAVIHAWKQGTGLTIHDCYGQTETVCVLGNYPFMPVKPGSMGRPTPGHVVVVVNDDGEELEVGKPGKIAVRIKPEYPPGLLREYWRDPESMSRSFRGDWYYTGDVAYRDADGYFWFVGRDDDVIKSSGYRIGPFEVESALQEHPAVAESAAIGVPDPVRGQAVKAFIVLNRGYEASDKLVQELQETVKRVTAPYKYPRHIEFVSELPKTNSGKILRSELRKRAAV